MPLLPTIAGFTISTTSALPCSIGSYQKLIAATDAAGLDLDLTSWIGRTRYQSIAFDHKHAATPVNSLCLSGLDTTGWLSIPYEDTREQTDPFTVTIRLPAGSMEYDLAIVQDASRLWSERPWLDRVTIVVPATAEDGGRMHLSRLRSLRRFTEEWNLDLGFDLSPLTDARWEAEAAILLAGDRLTTVRLTSPLHRVVDRKTDVLNRTLSALAETNFAGTFSIAPTVPMWLSWHLPSVIRDVEANRDAIAHIFMNRSVSLREPFELRHR